MRCENLSSYETVGLESLLGGPPESGLGEGTIGGGDGDLAPLEVGDDDEEDGEGRRCACR